MKHIWIEVDVCNDHAIITDWTDWFNVKNSLGHWRDIDMQERRFYIVIGKTTTYHIAGFDKNEKLCKDFAIWYHITRHSASDRTYRLD